jgi:hypothetical protein
LVKTLERSTWMGFEWDSELGVLLNMLDEYARTQSKHSLQTLITSPSFILLIPGTACT